MSHVYTEAKRALLAGELDFDTNTFKVRLVMTNTDCDTNLDAETLTGFANIDENDGTGYVEKTLASLAVTADTGNDWGEFTAAAVTWTGLLASTRSNAGLLLYKFVVSDTDSVPIAYLNDGGFPFAGNGSDVTWTPNAQGILQAT